MLQAIAEHYDPLTLPRLEKHVHEGVRLLDVGTGAGTVAVWAQSRGAKVTATDVDLSSIPKGTGVNFVEHDFLKGLDPAAYDVVVARAVLPSVPAHRQEEAVQILTGSLRPGGVLIVIESPPGWPVKVLAGPPGAERVMTAYAAAELAVAEKLNPELNLNWPYDAFAAMENAGLDVTGEAFCPIARREEPGRLGQLLTQRAKNQLFRQKLLAAGLSEEDLDTWTNLIADPDIVALSSPVMWLEGRKPGAA